MKTVSECHCCERAINHTKRLMPDLREDIIEKIKILCPKCSKTVPAEEATELEQDIIDYFITIDTDTQKISLGVIKSKND